jgi:hypothetical protein
MTAAPRSDAERAIWDLTDCVVNIEADDKNTFDAEFTPIDDETAARNPSGKERLNLAFLPDIGDLTQSITPVKAPPLSARVLGMTGRITAQFTAVSDQFMYEFKTGDDAIVLSRRFLCWHVKQELTFRETARLIITSAKGGRRVIEVKAPSGSDRETDVVIGNFCLCPETGPSDHFYAYYHLIDRPGRRPLITSLPVPKPAPPNPDVDPEHCGGGRLLIYSK